MKPESVNISIAIDTNGVSVNLAHNGDFPAMMLVAALEKMIRDISRKAASKMLFAGLRPDTPEMNKALVALKLGDIINPINPDHAKKS